MNDVVFNELSRIHLLRGVDTMGEAVGTTFGPNGKNVIIKSRGGIHITKDGATVAQYVTSENELEQMAMDVVREVASKTAKDVGDGTTSATILTKAIVDELTNSTENPIQIQRELQSDCKKVIGYLEHNKMEISSFDDIKKVATLSANNDEALGQLIAEAYEKVGKHGVVNIEESTEVEDSFTVSEGMQIESGYISPFFINTDNNTCELENVKVYISDTKLKNVDDLLPMINQTIREKKSLLIVAPDIDSTIQRNLMRNMELLPSCCIKCPNTGRYREIMLNDLREMLGSSMCCLKVIVTKDDTTFIGCEELDHKTVIDDINNHLANPELPEPEINFYVKRLANFEGGICTIKVGGYSEVEIKEKKDRVEDAVCATRAALEGGILPGGGFALYQAFKHLDLIHGDILTAPIKTLCQNSDVELDENKIKDFWIGINYKTYEIGNLYELGVVDPFLVTKTALENAVSAATLILTNGCAIIKLD